MLSVLLHPSLTSFGADPTGPIENAIENAEGDWSCDPYLCRGYQYEDNSDNVQQVAVGDVIYFHIELVAAHRPGIAVSQKPLLPGRSHLAP